MRIESARLALRPFQADDVAAVAAYRGNPEVCRFVPFEPMDAELVRDRIEGLWHRLEIGPEQPIVLAVELRGTGTVVGDVTLMTRPEQCVEIGYIVNPDFAGAGVATEAAHLLLHLAFDRLGFRRTVARIDAENTASARVAAKLGMRQEAHLIQNEWFKGRWGDQLDFAMLATEWRARHDADPTGCKLLAGGRADGSR